MKETDREDHPLTLGVDIGATKILIGAVARSGEIVRQQRYGIDLSSERALKRSIYASIGDFLASAPALRIAAAIGIGVFGHADFERGEWLGSMRMPGMDKLRFREELRRECGLEAAVDNDVHAAALAERHLGAGRRYKSFLYINVGTGIAAGLVADGRLIRGAANFAGEIGHMYVGDYAGSETCMCGGSGCLETVASGSGMMQRAARLLGGYPASRLAGPIQAGRLVSDDIFGAAAFGDPLAVRLYEDFSGAMETGLVSLVHIFNPEAVIMGGGVLKDKRLLAEISGRVYSRSVKASAGALKEIALTGLGSQTVGLLGAACLAWEHEREIREQRQPET